LNVVPGEIATIGKKPHEGGLVLLRRNAGLFLEIAVHLAGQGSEVGCAVIFAAMSWMLRGPVNSPPKAGSNRHLRPIEFAT
jgi:hypothetical protein